jgi:hypothetical protein
LEGASRGTIKQFTEQLEDLLQRPVLAEVSEAAIEAAEEWDSFCDSFFKTYQRIALTEMK